ncbi:polyhydroxyalkanoate synthesis regulator DNA-binding domain-containing protein [Pedosphaera parvula]|uniref:PHA accumulation regulator DNA-binding protein n=1 Tax=Pedosphaera parvula (strain Ellin514) TaxID=320771 RepID=B9XLM3_PEDPL|nr:polyhydroxyalkanoate synthesis regulator DNA-binding domain-containing protein [Pedosphaera parvula]EEF59271.1 PHA accumulation regulator DNA-binding protein [Pedosphaera parvula Ellin514]
MPDNAENNPKHIEIRKYPNRRYYDVTRSKHLTLEDIRSLVREGSDIRVTDSKTSANITAKVLAQIILELDSQKIDMFPVALLMRLIRVNDQMAKDFLERYFDQALSMFLEYRKQFAEQLQGGDGLGAIYSSLANWNRAMLNPFAMQFMGLPGRNPGAAAGEASASKEAPDLQDKVRDLEQQIANLEAKLAAAAKRPKAKPRRRTR